MSAMVAIEDPDVVRDFSSYYRLCSFLRYWRDRGHRARVVKCRINNGPAWHRYPNGHKWSAESGEEA